MAQARPRREPFLSLNRCGIAVGIAVLVVTLAFALSTVMEAGDRFRVLTEMTQEEQLKLAMSAAPPEIASQAAVYVLGPKGYVRVRTGTNGFTCLVERQHLETLEPTCYDAEGSATTLQARLYVEELRAMKLSEDEIAKRIAEGYAKGVLRAPRKPGLVYMLSSHNRVMNDRTGKIIMVSPHVMFYAPYARQADFGPFIGPHMPYVVLEARPDAYIVVDPGLMASALQGKAGDASEPKASGTR
jgi:hypothetical protein